MPLSAHEQRVLAAVEDELHRHDPQLAELLARGSPPPTTGARRFAVSTALAVWALIIALTALSALSGVGLTDAALIVVALGMLVGAHVARYFAHRALYRLAAVEADRCRNHED